MGSLFRPSPAPSIAAPPPALPSVPDVPAAPDQEESERQRRLKELARRQRGRASMVTTSPAGLLILSENAPKRRSLLGE